MPGIDALRAIAVLAVFAYHAGVGWMPGGFLGVDVFFVISGYLITSLLLAEYRRGGHIRLGRFWVRRARRLLPAVGVLVAVTMVVAAIADPDRIESLRGDAIASLAYVGNWHFIFDQQSYFDQFQRPSLFRHLWSLSVEEQFYLFWPLAFAAGMKLAGPRRLLAGVLVGALASVALAWVLFDPHDASRAYYGTDTHAVGLLLGVALALLWGPWDLRRGTPGRWTGPILDAVGVLALGYLVISFLDVHDYDLGLFHGGYLWLAAITAVLIGVLAHPAPRLGGLIAQPPMVWLGLRSYSFYLWHWPVLALTRPGIDVSFLSRGFLIPLQLLAVLALAELSYRYVERPFRSRPAKGSAPGWKRYARPALLAGVPAAILVVGWSGIVSSGGSRLDAELATASTAEHAKVEVAPSRRSSRAPRVVALGDSVMIAAKERLAARLGPKFSMNARVARQADEFVEIAEGFAGHGANVDALVIQMGSNGPLYSDEMEALRAATRNVGELYLINDHAPVSWLEESNDALAEAARTWPHTTLVDWASVAGEHEKLLWDDIHLNPAGAGVYTRVVSRAVHARLEWPKLKRRREPRPARSSSSGRASGRRGEGGSRPSSGSRSATGPLAGW
jgi:peptidoglycan/LPS O-acetylase OafA/YrhL